MTVEGQHTHDLALSLSKGGRGHQGCFDKLSTRLLGWVGEGHFVRRPGRYFAAAISEPIVPTCILPAAATERRANLLQSRCLGIGRVLSASGRADGEGGEHGQ